MTRGEVPGARGNSRRFYTEMRRTRRRLARRKRGRPVRVPTTELHVRQYGYIPVKNMRGVAETVNLSVPGVNGPRIAGFGWVATAFDRLTGTRPGTPETARGALGENVGEVALRPFDRFYHPVDRLPALGGNEVGVGHRSATRRVVAALLLAFEQLELHHVVVPVHSYNSTSSASSRARSWRSSALRSNGCIPVRAMRSPSVRRWASVHAAAIASTSWK